MTPTTPAPPDLAQHVAWLEQLLKPGYSITRTRYAWYLKQWGSWIDIQAGYARMSWREVDSDPRLSALLARLGEHS